MSRLLGYGSRIGKPVRPNSAVATKMARTDGKTSACSRKTARYSASTQSTQVHDGTDYSTICPTGRVSRPVACEPPEKYNRPLWDARELALEMIQQGIVETIFFFNGISGSPYPQRSGIGMDSDRGEESRPK